MRFALALLASIATPALSNPIATANVEKVWERCLVSLGEGDAHVSCAVGYSTRSPQKAPFFIRVPVFVPSDTPESAWAKQIRARLEFDSGGLVQKPLRYEDGGSDGVPSGMKRIDCVFAFGSAPASAFSIVVSYRQPLQNGQFFYLPQFEDGARERDAKSFSLTAFPAPAGDRSIRLVSPKGPKDTELSTRITVVPKHRELIVIETK